MKLLSRSFAVLLSVGCVVFMAQSANDIDLDNVDNKIQNGAVDELSFTSSNDNLQNKLIAPQLRGGSSSFDSTSSVIGEATEVRLDFLRDLEQRDLQTCGSPCSNNNQCNQNVPCRFCNGVSCYSPYKCGLPCNNNNACQSAVDGCTLCANGRCMISNYGLRSCVSDFNLLQNALNSVDSITLCQNSSITVVSGTELTSDRNNISLSCEGGSCRIIRISGTGRLMSLNGNNIRISGIIFQGGLVTGSGGALFIRGSATIDNCSFLSNRSLNGEGGAAYIGSGTVSRVNGNDNFSEGTCNEIFVGNTRQCFAFGSSGNLSNCGNECNNDTHCSAGPCFRCNLATKRCDFSGGLRACNNDETGLRRALQSPDFGTVEICPNTTITLTSEISTASSNKVLLCQNSNSKCEIRRDPMNGSRFRLFNFSGNNIRVSGIIFSGGDAGKGDGGALLLQGSNSQVNDCVFIKNRSKARGGAVSIKSGYLEGNSGSGNFAAQCPTVYNALIGFCSNW